VRLERPSFESGEFYRVQVASFSNQEAAENLRRRLGEQFHMPVVVYRNSHLRHEPGPCRQVCLPRRSAGVCGRAAGEGGYRDFLIVRETTGEAVRERRCWHLRRPGAALPDQQRRLTCSLQARTPTFLPLEWQAVPGFAGSQHERQQWCGCRKTSWASRNTSWVFVPAELSPTSYPEAAALAAQAIAARTYALKNLGRFRAEGFDLNGRHPNPGLWRSLP